MRCINCNVDNNLRERTENLGKCKNCEHDFVFEPTIMRDTKVTDAFFAKLILDISANNTLFFTPSQLYYLLKKRSRSRDRKNYSVIIILLIFIFLSSSIDDGSIIGLTISIFFGVVGIYIYSYRQLKHIDRLLIDRAQFDRWLARWNSINDSPEKILPPPQISSLPVSPNPEITAYSFDRVVVCDTPEIAQMLISNKFHFEHNCAILSIDGYPQSIFTITMDMLRRNPDLKVYALHNCSPSGIQIRHRLRQDNNWFPDLAIPVIAVGILPRQIMDNRDLLVVKSPASAVAAQQLNPEIRDSLNPAELAWLDAGCYLELESFSPRKLIQILQRSISNSQELTTIKDDEPESIDSYPEFYTVESFG